MRRPSPPGKTARSSLCERVLGSVPVRVAFLSLLVTIAYGGILTASVAWDDAAILSANPAIRSLDHPWRFFTDPWTINPAGGAMLAQYRPLRTFLFACEYAIFGGNAWGYHLVSLLLHGLCAWAVGCLTGRLFGRGAWLAGGVWLLHPSLSENALYLAAQSNELCVLGAALAVRWHLQWLNGGPRWNRVAAVAAALGSMLSYEFGTMAPALVLLAEIAWRSRGGKVQGSLLKRHLPYWLALGAFLAARAVVVEPLPRGEWWEGSWTGSLLMQVRLWLEGWRLSALPVVPLPRYMPYDIPSYATAQVAVLFHAAMLGAVVIGIWKRKPVVSGVIVWWYVAQLPTSNLLIANLGYPFAPRFLLLALLMLVAAASAWVSARAGGSRVLQVLLLAAALAAIAADRRQASTWHNETTLFREIARRSPNDFTAHYNLGLGYLRFGMLTEAGESLARAAELDPGFAPTFFSLGDVARARGNYGAARIFYEMTLQRYPKHIGARLALAELDLAGGQKARAESWVAPIGSLAKWPPHPRAKFEVGLASVAEKLGRCVEARRRVGEALRHWDRTSDVLFPAGRLLVVCGERDEGLELLQRASERAGGEYREMVGDTFWLTD